MSCVGARHGTGLSVKAERRTLRRGSREGKAFEDQDKDLQPLA